MTTWTIPVLTTDRLVLRAPVCEDIPAFTAFYTSPRSHIVGGPLDARGAYRAMLAGFGAWALRGYGLWHIAERASDRFLGWTGVIFAPGWAEPELGWTLMAEAEGKGIAFEAATAARDHAARALGIDRMISYIAPHNARSQALARRLGARHEADGTLLGHDVQIWRHPAISGGATG